MPEINLQSTGHQILKKEQINKKGEVNKLGVMTGTHIRAIEIQQKAVGVLHRQQRAFVL